MNKSSDDNEPLTIHETITKYQMKGEPVICKHFGCGEPLSCYEQRYGEVCSHHTGEEVVNKNLVTFFKQYFIS